MAQALGACALLVSLSVASSACEPDRPDIDPFPIEIDREAGPVTAMIAAGDGDPIPAVVDILSPHTARVAEASSIASRIRTDVTLFSRPAEGEPVPRARFGDATLFEYHPCRDAGLPCRAGEGDAAEPFEAVLGTDLLAQLALRLDFRQGELHLLPDIPLGDPEHAAMCKAAFRDPFAGGGTLAIDGAEESFDAQRPALRACFDFRESPAEAERGTDALLLLSTGTGTSLLGESAYERYRTRSGAPAVSELPAITLHLPSGPVEARAGEVSSVTLAARESPERGPCAEIYTHRVVRRDACAEGEVDSCPCPGGEVRCRAGGIVDLRDSVRVAVVADDHPLLQSLRSELAPALPDIDGILGANALADLRLELDYPNSRLLFSCPPEEDCGVYPALVGDDALARVRHCPAPE